MLARRSACPLRALSSTVQAWQSRLLGAAPPECQKSHLHRLEHGRTIFDAARSLLEPDSSPSPTRVVLLSGFLGAGKTTVLEQLLHQQHGFKLGVIVNDLASVNVDANVLRDAIKDSGTQSVSLENGCVCCTAADDLLESVQGLLRDSGKTPLDAIVVEMSGVAEPARARQMLETPAASSWFKKNQPLSVRTVTVVDSPAFATDYMAQQSAHDNHGHSASGGCDERYGALLAEQVEGADLLMLNKSDIATAEELSQAQVMVKALNETADIWTTEHGKVQVDKFLAMEPVGQTEIRDADKGLEASAETVEPVKSCCAAKTCSSTNKESVIECAEENEPEKTPSRAETRFGITSFVYRTDRLMSRAKLLKQLGEWQKDRDALGNKLSLVGLSSDAVEALANGAEAGVNGASPLTPILRSKGILYLDANPEVAFYWSHAGKSVQFSVFGSWPESTPQIEGGFGARRTEVVFIGAGYEERAIRDLLDSCLLSDAEIEFMKKISKH